MHMFLYSWCVRWVWKVPSQTNRHNNNNNGTVDNNDNKEAAIALAFLLTGIHPVQHSSGLDQERDAQQVPVSYKTRAEHTKGRHGQLPLLCCYVASSLRIAATCMHRKAAASRSPKTAPRTLLLLPNTLTERKHDVQDGGSHAQEQPGDAALSNHVPNRRDARRVLLIISYHVRQRGNMKATNQKDEHIGG